MPIPTFSGLPPYPEFNDVVNKINKLVNELRNLMLNLDTLNVVSLNAKVIEAGTITADKMNVSELSAISANLGTIIAGLIRGIQIYGSYIATREGTFPRSEMNAVGNFFAAYKDANNSIRVVPDYSGLPVVVSTVGGIDIGTLASDSTQMILFSLGKLTLSASGDINLNTNGNLNVPQWTKIYSPGNNQTLQQALNNKANVFSGYSGSFTVSLDGGGTRTLTFSNGILVS